MAEDFDRVDIGDSFIIDGVPDGYDPAYMNVYWGSSGTDRNLITTWDQIAALPNNEVAIDRNSVEFIKNAGDRQATVAFPKHFSNTKLLVWDSIGSSYIDPNEINIKTGTVNVIEGVDFTVLQYSSNSTIEVKLKYVLGYVPPVKDDNDQTEDGSGSVGSPDEDTNPGGGDSSGDGNVDVVPPTVDDGNGSNTDSVPPSSGTGSDSDVGSDAGSGVNAQWGTFEHINQGVDLRTTLRISHLLLNDYAPNAYNKSHNNLYTLFKRFTETSKQVDLYGGNDVTITGLPEGEKYYIRIGKVGTDKDVLEDLYSSVAWRYVVKTKEPPTLINDKAMNLYRAKQYLKDNFPNELLYSFADEKDPDQYSDEVGVDFYSEYYATYIMSNRETIDKLDDSLSFKSLVLTYEDLEKYYPGYSLLEYNEDARRFDNAGKGNLVTTSQDFVDEFNIDEDTSGEMIRNGSPDVIAVIPPIIDPYTQDLLVVTKKGYEEIIKYCGGIIDTVEEPLPEEPLPQPPTEDTGDKDESTGTDQPDDGSGDDNNPDVPGDVDDRPSDDNQDEVVPPEEEKVPDEEIPIEPTPDEEEPELPPEEPEEPTGPLFPVVSFGNKPGPTDIYINGRPVTDGTNETITFRKLKFGHSSIDLYVEFGTAIKLDTVSITSDVDIVKTDTIVKVGDTKAEMDNGRVKLVQIINTSFSNKQLNIIIDVDGIQYVQKIIIYTESDAVTYGIGLHDITSDTVYNANGDIGYPLSESALPIPILNDQFKIIWRWNNTRHDIDSDAVNMKLFYPENIIDVSDKDNIIRGVANSVNNITFNVKSNVIDRYNVDKEDFYYVIVVEYTNKAGDTICSRGYLLTRLTTVILDDWGIRSNNFFIDRTDTKDGTYRYTIPIEYPKFSILNSPYAQYLVSTGVNGVNNKLYNIFKYEIPYTDETFRAAVNLTGNGGEIDVFYNSFLPIETGVTAISHSMRMDNYQVLTWYNKTANVSWDYDPDNPQEIVLGQNHELKLQVTNVARVEFDTVQNGPVPTITTTNNYKVWLPYKGHKVYPVVDGVISISVPEETTEGPYDYTLIGYDSDGIEVGRDIFTLRVVRPTPYPSSDFNSKLYPVNMDQPLDIPVNVFNVYKLELMNYSAPDTGMVELEELLTKHNEDVALNGTYETYSFTLRVTGTKVGSTSARMIFYDDRDMVIHNIDIRFDVYTTDYIPEDTEPDELNWSRGLEVNISYTPKEGYRLPLAFINNGEELDGLIVAKYPLPQEIIEEVDPDREAPLLKTISKPNTHRMWYNSQDIELTDQGDGDYFKLANPKGLRYLMEEMVYTNYLNGNCYPIMNSSYLDTMLTMLADAHTQAGIRYGYWNSETVSNNAKKELGRYGYWDKEGFVESDGKWKAGGRYYPIDKYVEHKAIDTTNDDPIPMIINNPTFSHNGQECGIQDAFGLGVKVYSDFFITNEEGVHKLNFLDPYIGKMEWNRNYETNLSNNVTTAIFKDDLFLPNVDYAYIGSNEFKEGRSISIFSGADYDVDDSAALMDGAGIPLNTLVYSYVDTEVFQGNVGYRYTDDMRHGGSTYSLMLKKILPDEIGYFMSGTYSNHHLLKYTKNENDKHVSNMYGELINRLNAGYRSRSLINSKTLYNYNRGGGNVSDQIYFNNRVHFAVYDIDKMDRKDPTRLKILNANIQLEEEQSVVLEYTTDANREEGGVTWSGVDDTYIAFDGNRVTGIKQGITSFTLTAQKTAAHNKVSKIVNVEVLPKIPDTYVYGYEDEGYKEFNKNNTSSNVTSMGHNFLVEGLTLDTFKITYLVEEGTNLVANVKNPDIMAVTINRDSEKDPLPTGVEGDPIYIAYTVLIELTAVGMTDVIIKIAKPGLKQVNRSITGKCRERVATRYEIKRPEPGIIDRSELANSISTEILHTYFQFGGTNITDIDELCIWCPELANNKYVIDKNNGFRFRVDFGSFSKTEYTIHYKAQIRQTWDKAGAGSVAAPGGYYTIPAKEPKPTRENFKDLIVKGSLQVIIPYMYVEPNYMDVNVGETQQFKVKANLPVDEFTVDISTINNPFLRISDKDVSLGVDDDEEITVTANFLNSPDDLVIGLDETEQEPFLNVTPDALELSVDEEGYIEVVTNLTDDPNEILTSITGEGREYLELELVDKKTFRGTPYFEVEEVKTVGSDAEGSGSDNEFVTITKANNPREDAKKE